MKKENIDFKRGRLLSYFIIGLSLLPGFGCQATTMQRPNVVVFLVDDMGVMDTSVPFLTGLDGQPKRYPLNDFYRTPSMERLAKMGIRFETFYANSVCSPSRVSLLTGQSSARHKTTQWINPNKKNPGPADWNWEGLHQSSVSLPSLLQENGYRTIHVGKAHMGPRRHEGEDPRNVGFDVNVAGGAIGHPRSYYGEKSYGAGDPHQPPHLEAYHGTDTFLTEALTLEAIKKVDEAVAQEVPFFLHLSHYAVHAPFDPDPRFVDNYESRYEGDEMPAFASLVEGMDKSLGDLLDHLEAIGQAENTIIFFLGDNGTDAPVIAGRETGHDGHEYAAPLRGCKGACYEGGMRVAFIAAWAKTNESNPLQRQFPVAQGAIKTSAFASIEDLMPTILAISGIDAPTDHEMDGINIFPALANADVETGRERFLMHFPHSHRSNNFTTYREANWKLIHHYSNGAYELYDLSNDPTEEHDLAPSSPDPLARMQQAMELELERVQAQFWNQ